MRRLIDAGKDHRFRMLAEKGCNRPFLFGRGVAAVEDENLKPRGQEYVVQRPQIVGKYAVGKR